jgi:acetylornithine/succinyldiaminopimelate/putrescine aminotransferase
VDEEGLLDNVRARGAQLREGLEALKKKFSFIGEIRGEGLMFGIDLSVEGGPYISEALKRGLLMNCTHDYTLRLLPPFVVTAAHVRKFLKLFETVLAKAPRVVPEPAPAHVTGGAFEHRAAAR